jgi:lipopolysaccharide/colanic/teichoic acid biosynthesis glycosyltransferase
MKRAFDIVMSLIGLVLALPVMTAVAFAMTKHDPGPLFYRQTRIGRNKRSFQMVKFRTMVVGADKLGPHVTAIHDPRITPVGAFLRRSKLDELPELWNVLVGDMSLVGPRPEVPRYVDQYRPEWDDVFDVQPGITDLATLQFRDEESVLEGVEDREHAYMNVIVPIKIRLAQWYVWNRTFALDLRILIDTVLAITIGKIFPMQFGADLADIASDELHVAKDERQETSSI